MPAESDIKHLLRRTEFVARPHRVQGLVPLSLEAAVDDILAVPADPGTAAFAQADDYQRGVELTHYWLDRMAHDSPRPVQEKMAFFWHGHFCSDLYKVLQIEPLRQQIDLFRKNGMGNFRDLAATMSMQVAMLRYLDNNQNFKSSPNQNFARELMELFLLGVGNYTEADVEAGTAAWTGHTDDPAAGTYVWRPDRHDGAPKQFLGQTINKAGTDPRNHGVETIWVILMTGIVPQGAAVAANRGRPARDVAAEFLSRKLWIHFAGTEPPAAVITAMRKAALANDWAIKPWLRTMLLRPEFYSTSVKQGLVRSPVEAMVAMLYATGLRSAKATPLWWMDGMGQRPLFPPDVSGWKHNAYFVNPSAMAQRAQATEYFAWNTMLDFWPDDGDHRIHLGGGSITRQEMEHTSAEAIVDRILDLMRLSPVSATTRDALVQFSQTSNWWDRPGLVRLALLTPEVHLA